jgi:hypothetical protein
LTQRIKFTWAGTCDAHYDNTELCDVEGKSIYGDGVCSKNSASGGRMMDQAEIAEMLKGSDDRD